MNSKHNLDEINRNFQSSKVKEEKAKHKTRSK